MKYFLKSSSLLCLLSLGAFTNVSVAENCLSLEATYQLTCKSPSGDYQTVLPVTQSGCSQLHFENTSFALDGAWHSIDMPGNVKLNYFGIWEGMTGISVSLEKKTGNKEQKWDYEFSFEPEAGTRKMTINTSRRADSDGLPSEGTTCTGVESPR